VAELAAAAGLELSAAVYETSNKLRLAEVFRNWRLRKRAVVMMGHTGTGKTNLLRSLIAKADLIESISRYCRTQTAETCKLRIDRHPYRILDTPGQFLHESERYKILREVRARPPIRVINVVAWGYHEYDINPIKAIDSDNAVRAEFLEEHRHKELGDLRKWVPLLGDRESTKWILTAVVKPDLWWGAATQVMEYYRSGEYAREIKSFDPNLVHVVLPYCSVTHRFYDQVLLDGSFDDAVRRETSSNFLRTIVKLGLRV